jgi:hypothetical protein
MSTVTDTLTPEPVRDDLDAAPATLDRLHDVGVDLGDVGEVLESSGSPLLVILLDELTTDWSRCSEDVAQWLIVAGVAPDGRVEAIAARHHNQAREGCETRTMFSNESSKTSACVPPGVGADLRSSLLMPPRVLRCSLRSWPGSQSRPTFGCALPADLATQPDADCSRQRQVYRRPI